MNCHIYICLMKHTKKKAMLFHEEILKRVPIAYQDRIFNPNPIHPRQERKTISRIWKGVHLVLQFVTSIQNLVDRAPSNAERMKLKTRLQKILFFKDSSESPYEKKIQPILVCHPLEENLSSTSNSEPTCGLDNSTGIWEIP